MDKPLAVLSGMDTHPADSLIMMLRSVGYEVKMLSDAAMNKLEKLGYSGGVRTDMLKGMGYLEPDVERIDDFDGKCDVFFDLKRNELDTLIKIFPNLRGACYVINGGWDDYEDYGDYYPTISNNFWIKKGFTLWTPPANHILKIQPKEKMGSSSPIGLLHNAKNWGFGTILEEVKALTGVRVFGAYGSPAGMIQNDQVPAYMADASCFLHLKANDCPGWATYEAFATATPLVVTELFISRMRFQEMYQDGKTCLTWGKGSFSQDPRNEQKITEFIDSSKQLMIDQICEAVEKLKDPKLNREIGMAGYENWKKLTAWTEEKREAFRQWLKLNNLPCPN